MLKKTAPQTTDKTKTADNWQEQAQANLAGWQKALADYQNLQKETEQRLSQLRVLSRADLIHELLPIFDNYRLALEHVPPNERQSAWIVGLEHTLRLWEEFLTSHGIAKIVSLGQIFDPRWHESIGMVSDESQADQIVVEEKQAGYKCGDILLRPAKVIINNISK